MFGRKQWGTTKWGAAVTVIHGEIDVSAVASLAADGDAVFSVEVMITGVIGMTEQGLRGDTYVTSMLDTDHDIAGPIKMVITTPASGARRMSVECYAKTDCNVTLTEAVTIGAAGTALTLRNLTRHGTHPDSSEVLAEYGGTYTGGTEVFTAAAVRKFASPHWILKASTSYLITATSKADNNYTSVSALVWKG